MQRLIYNLLIVLSLILPRCSSKRSSPRRESLIVLPGIMADRRKRSYVRHYFNSHCGYDVYVPDLPYRRPLPEVVTWFTAYLAEVVKPERYERLYGIAYLGGRILLRCMPPADVPRFECLVHFRGPYQEQVAARLVGRIGRTLSALIAGGTVLDLADGWPGCIPSRPFAPHEALIVEQGRSRLARWLGIHADDVAPESWSIENLLPTAEAALRVAESHDEVYTTNYILAAALEFIQHGTMTYTVPGHANPGF